MAGEKEKPLTREDVLRLVKENGGKAEGLDLSEQAFVEAIDLSGLDLHGIILNKARFPPNLRRDSPLRGANLMGVHLEGAHLRSTHLEEADLSDAYLESASLGSAHLEGACFSGTHLGSAYLGGAHLQGAILLSAEFSTDTGLENVDWGNYILGDESMGFDWAAASYRQLKMWYTNAGMRDIAAKFYYREKEANRKALRLRSKDWHNRLAAEFMRVLFGYGERWERILIWMAFFVFGPAVAYQFGGLDIPYSLYFSVISFTALGYGKWVDITPQGWVQALGAFQSFTGVFLMALLLVTFFRKWTR